MDITKQARLDMDRQARALVLEAALGLPEWTFSRTPRDIAAAFTEIPQQHPDIDPSWFDNRDHGLYDMAVTGAMSVLQHNLGQIDAEEVVQNMVAGLSVTGGRVKSPYRWMGEQHARGILSGAVKPEDKFLGDLYKAGRQRGLDAVRKLKTQKSRREQMYPTLTRTEDYPAQVSAETVIDRTPGDVILSLLSSKAARPFKAWVYKTVEREANPVQLAVMNALLDDPGASNRELGSSEQVVAVRGEPMSGQMAGRHRDTITKKVQRAMKRDPKVLDWIDRYMDLAQLGFGGGSLRLASMARRVARRYLDRLP